MNSFTTTFIRMRWLVALGFLSVTPCLAAVTELDAAVSVSVQELINGEPASFNADDESRDPDGGNVPLLASSDIVSTDLAGTLIARGRGFASFADPTRLDRPNPEELSLEAACFSNDDSVAYRVSAATDESRTLRFSRSELSFEAGGTREIESSVFLSGALIAWATDRNADTTGLECEVGLRVLRDGSDRPLFDTRLIVTGGDEGLVAESAGSVRFDVVTLDELAARDIDDATLDVLRQVEATGYLLILVVPLQRHDYRYDVRADEPLMLAARLEARLRVDGGGTGVAVAMGRPFENLADFVELGLPGAGGESLQKALNAASDARDVADSPATQPPRAVRRLLPCGGVGIETMLASLLPLPMIPRRRRRTPIP